MLPSAEQIQIILPISTIILMVLSFGRSSYGVLAYFIVLNAKLGDMYPALGAIRFEFLVALIVLASIPVSGGNFFRALPQEDELNKSLWILFSLGMISVVQSVSPSVSWTFGGYPLLKLFCFYIMVVCSVRDDLDLRIVLWGVVLVVSWIAYEPVTNYFRGVVFSQDYGAVAVGRFGVTTGHVALANTLVQTLALMVFFGISQKAGLKRILCYFCTFFVVLGIVFTKSRGGFVGLVAVGLGFIYLSEKRLKTSFAMGLLLACILIFSGSDFTSRIISIGDGVMSSRSTSDRYMGLVNGIDMMVKRPILGVGVGAYAEARRQYFNYYFFSHNLYGELLGELGLASIFWFYWIYLLFKRSISLKKILNKKIPQEKFYFFILSGVQIGLFARLVIGNFSHCAFIWFWFLMAAIIFSIGKLIEASGDVLAKKSK